MAMSVDSRQQPQLHGMGYDALRNGYPLPHFTNPWVNGNGVSAAPSQQQHQYPTSQPSQASFDILPHPSQRPGSISIPYSNLTATAPLNTDLLNGARSYASQYPTTATSSSYIPTSGVNYNYAYTDSSRRGSQPMSATRAAFSDALEASHGMVAMNSDITPRNIYGNQGSSRNSIDSYGFPAPPHSAHSSISSASTYPSYYNGSVADSVSDYSSASESVEMNSRRLPRPSALMGAGIPPAPQSMMGQFSSKVSSSSQKKHKCKICDKRFTRPSSLQTHMYSHTGEKPFACEVEGCGRHFSVVSNLRRHRKVHKNEGDMTDGDSIATSPSVC